MKFNKFIVSVFMFMSSVAYAQEIATVETSGLVFKDTLSVHGFSDPALKGVTCYITLQNRSLSLENASDTSLSCVQTGHIEGDLGNRANIFSQAKNPFFKVMRVDRFFDSSRNVLIYMAYTTSTGAKNHSHSISVVPVRN